MRQAFTRAGLYYTGHAAEQMERRGITPDDVAEALDNETKDATVVVKLHPVQPPWPSDWTDRIAGA